LSALRLADERQKNDPSTPLRMVSEVEPLYRFLPALNRKFHASSVLWFAGELIPFLSLRWVCRPLDNPSTALGMVSEVEPFKKGETRRDVRK
jgi:hypothetical protein